MVADLTRFTACTVRPDKPENPVPKRAPEPVPVPPAQGAAERSAEEPVRLFVWASA